MPMRDFKPETEDTYVVSTGEFESLEKAAKRIERWYEAGKLKRGTKVYKVSEVYPVFGNRIMKPMDTSWQE